MNTSSRKARGFVRNGARAILQILRSLAAEPKADGQLPPSHVDFSRWTEKIAGYRAMGARIGEKVRLIGELDTVNPHLIEVGDYCVVGKGSILLSHCPINGPRPVKLGSFVYVGFGVIVLPGVTIGDVSVVGAGAVVTKSAPEGSILAGNPARILRALSDDERTRIKTSLREGRTFVDPTRGSGDRALGG